MQFHTLTAALFALAAFQGAQADSITTTVTKTLQRVVETVTSTRPSSGVIGTTPVTQSHAVTTILPSGSAGHVNGTTYAVPTVSASSTPAKASGAAVANGVHVAGVAAVAGLVGFLAI